MIKSNYLYKDRVHKIRSKNLYKDTAFALFIIWYFLGLYLLLTKDGRVTALSWSIRGMESAGTGRWQSHAG